MPTRFLVVTGGVLSSLGKGIAAASMGRLLVDRGFRVSVLKLDPYLNVDPGTMSPFQHGEVFVTARDGAETDLDLGHYERFLEIETGRESSVSAGQIYMSVIEREREGGYLGATVQVIPHITDEIKRRIERVAESNVDVAIIELGGTVGDIEGLPFLEAFRQMRLDLPEGQIVFAHLTLVPFIAAAGELKTKPTQHSVRQLMELGIQPDLLLCRTERPLPEDVRCKIARMTNVREGAVFEARDVESVYEIPAVFEAQGLGERIVQLLRLPPHRHDDAEWREVVRRATQPAGQPVRLGVVGKYVSVGDAYKSIREALTHGGIAHDAPVDLVWIDAEEIEREGTRVLEDVDGILVPGGFGDRGFEGKMRAVRFARENGVPFLGICLGLQAAVIEFARNVAGIESATSAEFDEDAEHPVVCLMDEQRTVAKKGGTMRLGRYPADLLPGSLAETLYDAAQVFERHRHRYEVNPAYRERLAAKGIRFSGLSPDRALVEMIELPEHPWFVATQAHPEFQSRPTRPHPLFAGFVEAAIRRRDGASA